MRGCATNHRSRTRSNTAPRIGSTSSGAWPHPVHSSRRRSMPALAWYDYAIVGVVPRVERGEFINADVIVSCASAGYLQARIELDEARLLALDPGADIAGI